MTVAFLYLPLIILAIMAFSPSPLLVWPPTGISFRWVVEAAANSALHRAVINSFLAAIGATGIALVLGTLASFAVQRFAFFGRQTVSFLLVLPIALPGVVTGISLQTTFRTVGIDLGLMTIIVGHATFCVVIVYNNVIARLRRMPRSAEEASADLGADTFVTFRRITLPAMRTALLAGALLAFALSLDEVIVTLFTAGPGTQTIPMWIFTAIQRPTQLPVVNVVALLLLLLSVIPVYVAQRISGGEAAGVAR
ncbi:MAG TPA: ABC transporter permease [Pleomorphomonadaceae bacterium]|nr:ABC transporter permease [Pleomorphomonadaceae bacterium]